MESVRPPQSLQVNAVTPFVSTMSMTANPPKAWPGGITRRNSDAVAIQADVSSEPQIVSLFEQAGSQLGPVSALVNNAATLEIQTRLDSMEASRIQRIFAVNVLGAMICAREAVRRMSTRHGAGAGEL